MEKTFFECLGKMFLSIEKLSLSFMPHVGPKWNIYLSHYCAKFDHKVCARLGFNVFWFVKCMKIRKSKIEIISI